MVSASLRLVSETLLSLGLEDCRLADSEFSTPSVLLDRDGSRGLDSLSVRRFFRVLVLEVGNADSGESRLSFDTRALEDVLLDNPPP